MFFDPNNEFEINVMEEALGNDKIHLNFYGVAELARIYCKYLFQMSGIEKQGNWKRQNFPHLVW